MLHHALLDLVDSEGKGGDVDGHVGDLVGKVKALEAASADATVADEAQDQAIEAEFMRVESGKVGADLEEVES